MATISDLSIEVIYIILQQKILDIEDVINFSLTCRRFNDALNNNLLWRTKLYQSFDIKWPFLKKIYDNRIQNKESINFKDEVKANVNVERNVRKALFSYLSLLSKRLFYIGKPYDSHINDFDILFRPNISAHTKNYYFLKNELLHQIKMSPLHPKCNLTHQYYSKMLLPFLQRRHLEDVWIEFLNYPKEQQLFENAATLLAQWYQPEKQIYNFDIEASLDDIAQQTLNSLKKAHWDHPIFSTSAKRFSFWKSNNIYDNQWSKIEGKQIIDVLITVFFDELGFHLHSTRNPKPEDIFIDCVLESKIGTAMTLAIIFQSVARRLGVCCDLVDSVLGWLCWKPKSIADNHKDEEYFYIDILHGGTIRGIGSYNKHEKISFVRDMVSIMHSKLKTDTIFNEDWTLLNVSWYEYVYVESERPDFDFKNPVQIENIYDIMNMSQFLSLIRQASLQRIQNNYNNRKSVASRRTEDILRTFEMSLQHENLEISTYIVPEERTVSMKYAVGMIVTCIENDLNQTGVIIGWDWTFKYPSMVATVVSDSQTFDSYRWNPFYLILSEDGKVYYAPQDTLKKANPRWIEHSEIGRYFCRFTDGYYVPNEILTRHYPHDQAFLNDYCLTYCFH